MSFEHTPWQAVTPADITWQSSGEPQSSNFGDIYYSRDNGPQESTHVFLNGNDLPQRWRRHPRATFCIGETGFGTALNFLMTWQAWRRLGRPRPRLHYLAIEQFPLRPADFSRALSAWPALKPMADTLLQQYPGLVPGQHRLLLDDGEVTLDLWWQDVNTALPDLASRQQACVDAWYLDGFAPSRNASMWRPDVLAAVAQLTRSEGTFATFTAAGQVRRDLLAGGFSVEKIPGFGRKRESLRGRRTRTEPPATGPLSVTPWDLPDHDCEPPASALVIGGGLAGCTAAAALARRGIPVTLLEMNDLAGAGSGNLQGVLYTRLSASRSPLADFAVTSYLYATRFYHTLFHNGALRPGIDGELCGSFNIVNDAAALDYMREQLRSVPDLAQVLNAAQARAKTGVMPAGNGFWFPASGWIDPKALCAALTDSDLITVRQRCGELQLRQTEKLWQAHAGGNTVASAACVIVAPGTATAHLSQLSWLPVVAIRGQTTLLPSQGPLNDLRAVVCHSGYIAPARLGMHCIGATFEPGSTDTDSRPQDNQYNLEKLADALPAAAAVLNTALVDRLGGRAGLRCASPDYLPIAGPVPDRAAFLHRYADLRKNARQVIPQRGHYLRGLYISTAHGSRGLTSTPLAAEILASQICGEPPPLCRPLSRGLAPGRFLIRDLSRNRI